MRDAGSSSSRLRLWLERTRGGFRLRDAGTEQFVRDDDPRIRVVRVAGVSYRPDALQDDAFTPGRRLVLVPEPDNEYDPSAVAVWNVERTLQAGYVPRDVAAELDGSEQAVALWRAGEGLRVLIAPREAWIGRPRR